LKRGKTRLFLYGSLMSGQAANQLVKTLPGARRVSSGWIKGRMIDLGNYPGVLREAAGGERVRGEVWEFDSDPEALRKLDEYEKFDRASPETSLFTRRRTRVRLRNGTIRAWAYFLTRRPTREVIIRSGDWRRGR
jgi:gamma-glutamylcyclotransferase (GGCT)/AIG2-like uncharacterized protein YtfP